MATDFVLARLEPVCRLLAQARDATDAKKVADLARAAEVYARRQRMGEEAIRSATAIKIDAMTMMGEFLKAGPKNTGSAGTGRPTLGGHKNQPPNHSPPTLKELRIDKEQSRDAQLLADLKTEQPEIHHDIRNGDKTVMDARRAMKERQREGQRQQNQKLVETAAPFASISDDSFSSVVIDPPWDWGDEGDVDQFGRGRPTYQTMAWDDLLKMPVGEKAKKNAHIYLWITNRSLPKGFSLLEAWDFRYVTCLTWCKPSIGMGNYFRGSTEQILFGVRGSLPILQNNVGTWFQANRPDRHSAKPNEFFELVEKCSPGPWLEIFSRSGRNGWTCWGAEVE